MKLPMLSTRNHFGCSRPQRTAYIVGASWHFFHMSRDNLPERVSRTQDRQKCVAKYMPQLVQWLEGSIQVTAIALALVVALSSVNSSALNGVVEGLTIRVEIPTEPCDPR